jgi:DeoR family transcriptional regulator, fructose operon transcriptional repressor
MVLKQQYSTFHNTCKRCHILLFHTLDFLYAGHVSKRFSQSQTLIHTHVLNLDSLCEHAIDSRERERKGVLLPATDSRLLPSQRQQRIRQLATQQGVLRIPDLAETLGVSEMTIRRDLDMLEDSGHVERTFGGAVVLEQTSFESSYTVRLHTHTPEKQALARYAASLINDGDTVAIDASTTCLALARELCKRRVTVMTNGLDAALELRNSQSKVILIGGYLRQVAGSFAGPLALKALEGLRVDHTFFSAKGILPEDGYLDSDLDEIEVKRVMIARAVHVVALMDASKFGVHALGRIAPLSAVHLLITDAGLDRTTEKELHKHKVKLKVVKA